MEAFNIEFIGKIEKHPVLYNVLEQKIGSDYFFEYKYKTSFCDCFLKSTFQKR